jgi:hypothetical protein
MQAAADERRVYNKPEVKPNGEENPPCVHGGLKCACTSRRGGAMLSAFAAFEQFIEIGRR